MNNLKHHVKKIHEGIKNFGQTLSHVCKQCGELFYRKFKLTLHIQSVHDGIKYKCNKCEKQYSGKNGLQQHIRYEHEVRYPCQFCVFRGTSQSKLRQHTEKIHDGEKYQCEFCEKEYKDLRSMRKHKKSAHPDETC